MNKQTIDEQHHEEKIPHILIGIDIPNKEVFGMKGVGKYDEYQTAPVNEQTLEQFKRFDKDDKFLSEFIVEFLFNMATPRDYNLFIVPESEAVRVAEEIKANISHQTTEGKALSKNYKIDLVPLLERAKKPNPIIDERGKQPFIKPQTPPKSRGRKM